ncbi:MAG TPA: hypothetical protein VIE64_07635 [Solirubrobacterales bacterium]
MSPTVTLHDGATDSRSVRRPNEWVAEQAEGGGPFTTRVTWRLPEGHRAVWTSRAARKRGTIDVVSLSGEVAATSTDRETSRRLRRVNAVAATAFAIGGSLFAIGAALAQGGVSPTTCTSVYLVGGAFFSTGGYASLLQVINGPRDIGPEGALTTGRWRWWSREPERLEWLSALVLFAGTLVFAVLLVDSFIKGLGAFAENRLVWSPDMVGCALFLISGHLAMVEICHGWPCWRRRDLGWWIVAVNQLGSVLFMVSAIASFVRPSTGDELAVGIANWGTLTGALCFAVGGVLQEFERPSPGPAPLGS